MNKIEIKVGDKKYNIKTDESPEYVGRIEQILNDQINNISGLNKRFNDIDRLILSSFVIVDKYIKAENTINELKNKNDDEMNSLRAQAEKALQEREVARDNFNAANLEKEKYREKLLARDSDREYLNSQIARHQDKINELDQQILQSEILINELKNKNDELNEVCENLTAERENFTKEINFMNNTKSSLNGRISKLQIKLNEREQYITQLEKSLKDVKRLSEDKSLKIDNLNEEEQKNRMVVNARIKDIEYLNNKISGLQQKLGEKDEAILSRDKAVNEYKNNSDELRKKYDLVNDEKEKYLEELLFINNEKEELINKINELQEKLNRKEAVIFQNQIEIEQLKKENQEMMELLDAETSK